MVLECGVPELADGTGLSEHAALVGVAQESHQPPWQMPT